MKYCVECGSKLILKHLDNEGEIPYCESCKQFRFPIFNTAVSMILVDRMQQKILLIKQYGRPNFILVAGYVNRGESVEDAVVREVKEETGLTVTEYHFNRSKFFEPSNTLMENFTCYIEDASQMNPNAEIDSYNWFTYEEAKENIFHGSLAEEFLLKALEK